jgi:hypothetical protein
MTDHNGPFDAQDGSGGRDSLPCVELEFATLRRFREEMAPYLNYDGFFARSDRPLPRGTSVEFKFVMPEDFVLAHGTAEVAWTIEPGNPDLVPGMALEFGEVGKQSRAVIDELVDFHIATGGDPFDVGLRGSRAGEILTDSLGGIDGTVPSILDAAPSMPQDQPLASEHENGPIVSSDYGVLPDWLSGSSTVQDSLDFRTTSEPRGDAPHDSGRFSLPSEHPNKEFDVDMIFDNDERDTTPHRPEEGWFQQMETTPESSDKPPRDLRLGLIVAAALVLIAVVVMVWALWLRKDDQVVQSPPKVEEVAETGVALIEDGTDVETPESVPDTATDSPADTALETAARVAAELGSETRSEPADADEPQGSPGSLTNETSVPSPNKAFVTERLPDTSEPAAVQAQASRVVDVVADSQGGVTTVTIRGNGVFDPSFVRSLRLNDPLRVWVSISHIESPFKPNEIGVGSREIERVRIGFHPEDSPPALYIVLDLAGDDVFLLDTSMQGDAIRLTAGRK